MVTIISHELYFDWIQYQADNQKQRGFTRITKKVAKNQAIISDT